MNLGVAACANLLRPSKVSNVSFDLLARRMTFSNEMMIASSPLNLGSLRPTTGVKRRSDGEMGGLLPQELKVGS